MKSARRLRPDRFIEIMEIARSFSKAKSTLGDRSQYGEHTVDPRANLVVSDLSDDESDEDGNKDDRGD